MASELMQNMTAGEERVTSNLLRLIAAGCFSHALLLTGSSSAGRFRTAQILTAGLLCEDRGENGVPCGNCSACRKVLAGEHTDVVCIGADKKGQPVSGDIKIDVIRDLRKNAYVLPTEADYHVYILADCERMNAPAQNALLKILEEPPENTVFFLLTASSDGLLSTVVSRSQEHSLGQSPAEVIEEDLLRHYPKADKALLKRAARLQSGFDRVLLDEKAIAALPEAFALAEEVFINKETRIIEKLPKKNDELLLTLCVLSLAARDIAVGKRQSTAHPFVLEEGEELDRAKSGFSKSRAAELYEAFSSAAARIRDYGNVNTVLASLGYALDSASGRGSR